MSNFYTAVTQYGNSILVKEIIDGKHRIRKVPYQPSFYIQSKDAGTQYRTMEGQPLKKQKFNSMSEAKDYVKRYKDVSNHKFYGNTNLTSQFICDSYPGIIDFDISQLGIWTIDIETKVEHPKYHKEYEIKIRRGKDNESMTTTSQFESLSNRSSYEVWDEELSSWCSYEKSCYTIMIGGFPHPAEAGEEIMLISMLNNVTKQYVSWGRLPFDYEKAREYKDDFDIDKIDLTYHHHPEEDSLLNAFLFFWKNTDIDCITNWNGESFDLPYIHNRIVNVLGADAVAQLSPFRIVRDRTVSLGDKEFVTYDFQGIAALDYLQLYKKFGTYSAKESYKLDYIGEIELGLKKVDMGCSFRDSYKPAVFTRFVLYNLRDCEIVDKLEDKMGLIALAYTIAYDAKCLPNDVFSPVKTWDCMMYRFMLEQDIIVPQSEHHAGWAIEGAYVKEPIPGQYDWVASFDAASLYPTLIRQYNMSPETLIDEDMHPVTVDGLIKSEYDLDFLKELQRGMASNGQMFRNDIEGLFPAIVSKQFNDRKMYKKLMQAEEHKLEDIKAEMKKRNIH